MKGNSIIVTTEPKGQFIQGYITGTPKPGTMMQIDVSEATKGGRFTWEAASPGADGDRMLTAILLEDELQGKLATEAYVAGDFAKMYVPLAGEEVNVLVAADQDAVAVGDLLIVDNGTGKFNETTGTPESEPFQALEALGTITPDTLCHVIATGQ